jgi:hypothetical protein
MRSTSPGASIPVKFAPADPSESDAGFLPTDREEDFLAGRASRYSAQGDSVRRDLIGTGRKAGQKHLSIVFPAATEGPIFNHRSTVFNDKGNLGHRQA